MKRYVIREYEEFGMGRLLLPLPKLIARLDFAHIRFWSLRRITLVCRSPFFGIPVSDVEKLSSSLSRGLLLADQDFQCFLKTDMQIIDGFIDGYSDLIEPLFQIECVDTSQWEISTNDPDCATELEKRGFVITKGD